MVQIKQYKLYFLGLLISIAFFYAHKLEAQAQYAYAVTFSDKSGAPGIENAAAYLSARSMARRAKFQVAIAENDRPVPPAYVQSVLTTSGGKYHLSSKWLNLCVILLEDTSTMAAVRNLSFVTSATWVGYYNPGLHKPAKDNKFAAEEESAARPLGDPGYYGASYEQSRLVNGDFLHDLGFKGEGLTIAFIDNGFIGVNTLAAYADMRNSGRLLDAFNFVNRTNNVYTDGTHGSVCFSTSAANLPGTFVGAAPHANYALYVTEDIPTEQLLKLYNGVAALERADSLGADITSTSLGYSTFDGPVWGDFDYSLMNGNETIIAKGANIAASKGMLVVNAAGNEGNTSWHYITSPGDADSVFSVGATTLSRTPASLSSYGPSASGAVKPDVGTLGVEVQCISSNGNVVGIGGTSLATPQIAGWAACLMQALPNTHPAQIREAIRQSAHLYPSTNPQIGYGVPDFRAAYQSLSNVIVSKDTLIKSVYPNPFKDKLNISVISTKNQLIVFRIFDAVGRLVDRQSISYTYGIHRQEIDWSTLPAGVYFLEAVSEQEIQSVKLVKQ